MNLNINNIIIDFKNILFKYKLAVYISTSAQ